MYDRGLGSEVANLDTVDGGLLVVIVIDDIAELLMRLVIPGLCGRCFAMRWALCLAFVTCFQPISAVFNAVCRQILRSHPCWGLWSTVSLSVTAQRWCVPGGLLRLRLLAAWSGY